MRMMKLAEVLDESLEMVKKNVGTILMYNLFFWLAYIGIVIVATVISIMFASISIITSTANSIVFFIVVALLILFFAVFTLSHMVGNIKIGTQYINHEKLNYKLALATTFKKLPTIAGILIAYILCMVPIGAISFMGVNQFNPLLKIFEGILFETLKISNIIGVELIGFVIAILGIIAFIITVTNFFTFSIHVAVIENLGPIKSIVRSFKLVKTQFWRVLGSIFLIQLSIAVIQYSLISFIGYCSGILYLVGKFLSFAPEELYQLAFLLVPYLQWPVNIMSYLFLVPMMIIMSTFLYLNIRSKTEGYDLVLKIDQLERNMESVK